MTTTTHIAKQFIPQKLMMGLDMAYKTMMDEDRFQKYGLSYDTIWPATACAVNYFSPAHVDDDSFLSLFTVMVDDDEKEESTQVCTNSKPPIVNHFVFPTFGVAVALQNGDILIFNTQYHHCCAHKGKAYLEKDVFLSSHYLKTAVTGGNDNIYIQHQLVKTNCTYL